MEKGDTGYLVMSGKVQELRYDSTLFDDGGIPTHIYKTPIDGFTHWDSKSLFKTSEECRFAAVAVLQRAIDKLNNSNL